MGAEPEAEGTDGEHWRSWRQERRQCLWRLEVGVVVLHILVICMDCGLFFVVDCE
jgi:hypothetical protein